MHKFGFDGGDDIFELREVTIVKAPSARELPDSLDGVEVWTVRAQEVEGEPVGPLCSPQLVEPSVVILGVVGDYDHTSAGSPTNPTESFHEAEEGHGVEGVGFPTEEELAVAQPYRAKVSDLATRRMVQQNRVSCFGGYPHPTTGAVLLEVHFVGCPKVHGVVSAQRLEFFLCAA